MGHNDKDCNCEKTTNEDFSDNLYRVKIIHSSEIEICSSKESYSTGETILVQTRYGKDLGTLLGTQKCSCSIDKENIFSIIRTASTEDIKIFENNKQKEKEAFIICKEKIVSHKLEMKLVSAHYLLTESKVLFFFTAEARVDFRELVKDLVSVFKMRIELRQIGVRDESRILGGMAVCGRTFCCHRMTDKLRPVSIKMAKEQNLSLNSMKISGPCGRLLCCLSYEYDFYHKEKRKFPSIGSRIYQKEIQYRVSDVNLVCGRIMLTDPENRTFSVFSDGISYDKSSEKWIISADLTVPV